MHIKHFSLLLTMVVLNGGLVVSAQINFDPYPVSEYAEQTGPNTMTFLSYPKYYKNALGELTPVDTTLVPSKSAKWDYEVSTGIWTLYVSNDGTFQARYKGDIFTYRFENLGIGRGNQFQALNLGKADWTNMMVIGDTVRWNEVLPNVDVTVRYIHDILKVDVKIKGGLMNQIRSQVRNGQMNANDYLTAQFEIPEVFISSQAKQGGVERDLYAEPISVNQPLEFVKDNKVVHKLRPVESYVLDDSGERILDFENPIRSQQQWRLNRNAPGIAEMSAHLGDLAEKPEGGVVIDPSIGFGQINRDTLLDSGGGIYGTSGIVNWHGGTQDERIVFGFNVDTLPKDLYVLSSSLKYYIYQNHTSSDSAFNSYKVTTAWDESTADWNIPWNTSGGDYDNSVGTSIIAIPYDYEGWVSFDVKNILNSHLEDEKESIKTKGFILKRHTSYDDGKLRIYMKETTYPEYRPILEINYIAPPEQIYVLDYPDGPELTLNHVEMMPIFDCAIVWSPSLEGMTYNVKLYSSNEVSHNPNDPDTWYHVASVPGGMYNAVYYWDETNMIIQNGSSMKIAINAQVNPETKYTTKPINNDVFFRIVKQKWSIIGEEIEWYLSNPSHLIDIANLLSQRSYTNWLPTHSGHSPGTNLRGTDFLIACQNPAFKIFYVFCHGGTTDGYPRGIILEEGASGTSVIEPSTIESVISGTPYDLKLHRRLLFFNSCNLASDFDQNFRIMREYMETLEAFGSGSWNRGTMAGYANQVSNSLARNFGKKFIERLVNNPSHSMNNSFNYAKSQIPEISQAVPTLQGGINYAFEESHYKF